MSQRPRPTPPAESPIERRQPVKMNKRLFEELRKMEKGGGFLDGEFVVYLDGFKFKELQRGLIGQP